MLAPLLIAVLLLPATANASAWRWPVQGEVVERYSFGPDPYARGQHRGIDIAGRPGAAVRAACAGRVRFAGRVPGGDRARGVHAASGRAAGGGAASGRAGGGGGGGVHTVSVLCGGLVASYLHLGSVAVKRGERVWAGRRLGALGAAPLHLGARRASERHGYVDPLGLLPSGAPGPAPPPLLPAARRPLKPSPVPTPAVRRAPARAPTRAPGPAPAGVPVVVWAGVGLLALAVPGLALAGGSRRRTRQSAGGRAAAGARAAGSRAGRALDRAALVLRGPAR